MDSLVRDLKVMWSFISPFVWGVGLLAGGLLLGRNTVGHEENTRKISSWPTTQATIVDSSTKDAGTINVRRSLPIPAATVHVVYEYEVEEGETRKSSSIHPAKQNMKMDKEVAVSIANQYAVGTEWTVAYNPDAPSEVYLEWETDVWNGFLPYLIGLILVFFGAGALAYGGILVTRNFMGLEIPAVE